MGQERSGRRRVSLGRLYLGLIRIGAVADVRVISWRCCRHKPSQIIELAPFGAARE